MNQLQRKYLHLLFARQEKLHLSVACILVLNAPGGMTPGATHSTPRYAGVRSDKKTYRSNTGAQTHQFSRRGHTSVGNAPVDLIAPIEPIEAHPFPAAMQGFFELPE
jgi:hypothetical protein